MAKEYHFHEWCINMYDKIISYVNKNEIIHLQEKYSGPYDNNEFLNISKTSEPGYQRLSGDLLMVYVKHFPVAQSNLLITPEKTSCVHVTFNQDNSIELHRHNYIEMVYVVEGELDFIIEEKYCRYKKGDFCIINQNVLHKEIMLKEYEALYFGFSKDYLRNLLRNEKGEHGSVSLEKFIQRNVGDTLDIDCLEFIPISERANRQLYELCLLLLTELLERQAGYKEFVCGYIKRIFSKLQDYSLYSSNNIYYTIDDSAHLFKDTLSYLQKHKYKVTRNELSAALNYNGNYIGEVFMKYTGVTIASYIRNMCLQEASYLLLNTDMKVTQIINQLHYENKTAFYKLFSDKYGMTPVEYRKHFGREKAL